MKLRTTALIIGLALVSCTKTTKTDMSQELIKPLSDDQVILEYNGGKITASDVQEQMKPQYEKIREQLLNSYIQEAENLLAQRMRDRFTKDTGKVTEAELDNYMKANKLPKTDTEKIREFLTSEKSRIQKQMDRVQVFNELGVKNKLGAARYDVKATSGMATQGPNSAKVTIQVFCDFANPICNRSRLTLGELKNELGDKVRWIFRHFPVASNPFGEDASLVALCAQEQDKFWPVHDRLFDNQATLSKENVIKIAVAAGVDEGKLKSCLESGQARAALDKELKDAKALGLTQTPAYFVNGTKINSIDQLKVFATSQASK
jgi:protein-disulfide isomerase